MWEAIATTLTSQNAIIVLAAVFLVLLLFGFYAKTGLFQLHKKGLRIGGECRGTEKHKERVYLKKQIEYIRRYMFAKEDELARIIHRSKSECENEGCSYFVKYLICLMAIDAGMWVMFNNMSKTQGYIRSRQIELMAFLKSRLSGVKYNEAALQKFVDGMVDELVGHLILIRNQVEGK